MPIGWVAAAGVVGSLISGNAATSAASTQAQAAQNAQNISQNEFNTITGQEQPYMNAGYGALSQLDYLMGIGGQGGQQMGQGGQMGGPQGNTGGGFNYNGTRVPGLMQGFQGGGGMQGRATAGQGMPGQMGGGGQSSTAGGYGSLLTPFTAANWKQMSPAYQFQLQQGQQGVLNADTTGQGALSGAAMKDLTGFNQGLANTSFNTAFNQYQTQQGNIYSRLSNLANLGQNAASNTGQQGTALAGQAAQSATNIGTALGAGQIGAANAYSSGLSNLGNVYAAYGGGGGGESLSSGDSIGAG